jgi:hypothetical protein
MPGRKKSQAALSPRCLCIVSLLFNDHFVLCPIVTEKETTGFA